jgi:hypothetical protein
MLAFALVWLMLGVSSLSACVMSGRADRVAQSIAAAEALHEELVLRKAA